MEITSEFFDSSKKLNLFIVGVFLVGLFVLALGVGLFFLKNSKGEDVKIISASPASQGEALQGVVVVDVAGAVVNPGVYTLSPNLRVDDAIKAAGGLVEEADTSKMNLAAKIADGQKIFVPNKLDSSIVGGSVAGMSSLVNINSATEGELDTLPGVGPVSAQKIIAGRPYGALEDLITKKVVSASVFEKIKDLITY
ncbi:MAG: ComEA family DNA-binding protein [Candidatus Curtissbacteria bacterium]